MMKLSEHFSLGEFIVSSTAEKLGNDNMPTPAHLENLKRTAAGMEKVRSILGDCAIVITSGYRNPVVNKAVGGVANSAHALGHAADFRAAGFSAIGAASKIRDAHDRGEIEFDQLILETSRKIVHISFDPEGGTKKKGMRGDVLTQKLGAGTPFQQGLHA
ncbi:MAG TPA: D-Ala-D-Ala carboxypeptidase family metallohydrolase [Allosphingosinicella sp.]|jgi:putative chitinase